MLKNKRKRNILSQVRVSKRKDLTFFTQNEKFLMYYRARPIQAAKDLLKIDLAWFQRITLRSMWMKPYTMNIFGRGCGKTHLIAVFAVLMAILYPNYKIGVLGPIKKQGDYIFNEIEILYNNSDFFQASTIKHVSRTPERSIVKFVNGSFIEATPVGDGSKIRGARYNCICLDEYAQWDESIINLVVIPFMVIQQATRVNKLVISSSAYYQYNHLYQRYIYYRKKQLAMPNLYQVNEYDYRDILLDPNGPKNLKVDMNVIKQQRELMTNDEFRMEYLKIFPNDADTFFSVKLIDECTPKPPKLEPIEAILDSYVYPKNLKTGLRDTTKDRIQDNYDYVMGVDIAKAPGGANFAIVICRLRKNRCEVVYCFTINGGSYKDMTNAIRVCTINFNITRIHMDRGGGGEAVKEELADPWVDPLTKETHLPILDMDDPGTENIKGLRYLRMINFHGAKHSNLFTNLKSEMEHGRVAFPITFKRDPDKKMEKLGQELMMLKQELMVLQHDSRGTNFHFSAPAKYRSDRAVALTLAVDTQIEIREHNWQETEDNVYLDTGFAVI